MTNQLIVKGSIGQIARRDGRSVARSFLDAEWIILVDTSGSMYEEDSTSGRARHEIATEELRNLQNDLPGKIAIFSYSTDCTFCPSGVPDMKGDDTNMLGALQYVKNADGTVKGFVILSDGYPDPGTDHQIVQLAKQMISPIHTVFCGPVEDSDGRTFMELLAKAGRGRSAFSANASDLGGKTQLLLQGR